MRRFANWERDGDTVSLPELIEAATAVDHVVPVVDVDDPRFLLPGNIPERQQAWRRSRAHHSHCRRRPTQPAALSAHSRPSRYSGSRGASRSDCPRKRAGSSTGYGAHCGQSRFSSRSCEPYTPPCDVFAALVVPDLVILAEGKTSKLLPEGKIVVKASGSSMFAATTADLVTVEIAPLLEVLRDPDADQERLTAELDAGESGGRRVRASIETLIHVAVRAFAPARYVAHTHPTAASTFPMRDRAPNLAGCSSRSSASTSNSIAKCHRISFLATTASSVFRTQRMAQR